MSDTREPRTPTEEAAELARAQTARQVDTWMQTHAPRMQKAWGHSLEGRLSWHDAKRQQWPEAKASEVAFDDYMALKSQWRTEVRDPAAQEMLLWEAVRQEVVTPTVAERYMHEVDHSRQAAATPGPPRPPGSLGHHAGQEAYEQTLRTWGAPRWEPSQEPTGRAAPTPLTQEEERAGAAATSRDQAECSPEMATRGWGQSWDAQQQEQGWNR